MKPRALIANLPKASALAIQLRLYDRHGIEPVQLMFSEVTMLWAICIFR